MKSCSICKDIKNYDEFSPSKKSKDGYASACKKCHAIENRNYRLANKKYLLSGKKWRETHKSAHRKCCDNWIARNRDKVLAQVSKYSQNNPEKVSARYAVHNAIRRGDLIKQPCEVCGSAKRTHGHHDNYSNQLLVRWLCPKHHKDVHLKHKQENL